LQEFADKYLEARIQKDVNLLKLYKNIVRRKINNVSIRTIFKKSNRTLEIIRFYLWLIPGEGKRIFKHTIKYSAMTIRNQHVTYR